MSLNHGYEKTDLLDRFIETDIREDTTHFRRPSVADLLDRETFNS